MKKLIATIFVLALLPLTAPAQTWVVPYGQTTKQTWDAKYFFASKNAAGPDANWYAEDFDDSSWDNIVGPVSTTTGALDFIGTVWPEEYGTIWVRRHFSLSEIIQGYLLYINHDDACEVYLNGHRIYDSSSLAYRKVCIANNLLEYVKLGDNVLAVKVVDSGGLYACVDFGLLEGDIAESGVVTQSPVDISFDNSSEYPWVPLIDDEGNHYIESSNYGTEKSYSSLKATFTIDKPMKLMWEWATTGRYDSSSYHYLDLRQDGIYLYNNLSVDNVYRTALVVLGPGTHTVEWLYWIGTSYVDSYKAKVRNIRLVDDWISVTNDHEERLGVKVLYHVDDLRNVECLRVHGPMESQDWDDIAQMTNLRGLDLTDAELTAIPANAFVNCPGLNYVGLPEGVTSLGDNAFKNIDIWSLDVPASVTSIGESCFADSRIHRITFPENSSLKSLGYRAFYQADRLLEFDMPDSVTNLYTSSSSGSQFYNCTRLRRIKFSNSLNSLPDDVCYRATALKSVKWPDKLQSIGKYAFYDCRLSELELPETVRSIKYKAFYNNSFTRLVLPIRLNYFGYYAFSSCKKLRYVETYSYPGLYDGYFENCTALDTVVCRSATPPSISSDDPFYGVNRGNITLLVPKMALANYRLDSYWNKFGKVEPYDGEIDYYYLNGSLFLGEGNRWDGKPEIYMGTSGKLTINGNDALDMTTLTYVQNGTKGTSLLSNCPNVQADSVVTHFDIEKNKWHFFTLPYDVELSAVKHSSSTASFVIRYYDGSRRTSGTGSSWQDVTEEILHAGQGYIIHTNTDGYMQFPAIETTRRRMFTCEPIATPLELHESANAANSNWNYIGNPYPCFYDIYRMDFTAPITVWTGSSYKAYSLVDDDFALNPMQSFFVQRPTTADNVSFPLSGRQTTATIDHSAASARHQAPAATGRYLINLHIEGATGSDDTRVVMNERRSTAYELDCDASKFMSLDATVPQIWTVDPENNRLAINERPQLDGVVALGVNCGASDRLTISALRADCPATLVDMATGAVTDLTLGSYTFDGDGGEITGRFYLNMNAPTQTGVTDAASLAKVEATVGAIEIEASGADVAVYNMQGFKVFDGRCDGSLTVPACKGVYVVSVGGINHKVAVK